MWVQISSGQGPEECALAAGYFLKALLKECRAKNLQAEVLNTLPGKYDGDVKSVLLSINGNKTNALAQELEGTICWICKSPYRPGHKRKNWFIDVKIFYEVNKLEISKTDVVVEFMRSYGPGGQNVNKVETAVRAIHLPTGLTVTASEERTQAMNRKLAMARLTRLLEEENKKTASDNRRSMWKQHTALVRGNPVRTYEGNDFRRKEI